jgi:HD-like signal output (HDOD) protein
MRREWQMSFAGSGHEALEKLTEEPFDMVVSDMRMPGMNGIQLLAEVKRRFPQLVRIILSGNSDNDLILKSVRLAHQCLHKPCDADTLKDSISRSLALNDLLRSDSLRCVVSKLETLPSLPSLYQELVVELRSSEPSIKRAGEIISKDVAMTAKILQLINSAFFGLPRSVTSATEACLLLGLETIEALVLTAQIFSQLEGGVLSEAGLNNLWNHSTLTALLAKEIANNEHTDGSLANDAFTAGLLHDVGKLVLATNVAKGYLQILDLMKEKEMTQYQAEQEVFGATHAEVGAYLVGIWGLGDPIVEALAFHHVPASSPKRSFGPLIAVHAANALQHAAFLDAQEETVKGVDEVCLAQLNLEDRLPKWRMICRQILDQGEASGR